MSSKNPAIPNFFYDLIVFVSPSILLVAGFILGYSEWALVTIKKNIGTINAIDVVLIISLFLFLAYEFGRMAEALSHFFVSQSFLMLRNKFGIFKNPDFSIDLTSAVSDLELPIEIEKSKKNNKWSIYFFALLYSPNIGQDLLKRYAWEKLSRSSAFTHLVLFLTSIVHHLLKLFGLKICFIGSYGFGSWYYTLFAFLFVILTYIEFYKRKCWNNDLLIKVLPILISAKKSAETNQPKIEIKPQ